MKLFLKVVTENVGEKPTESLKFRKEGTVRFKLVVIISDK